MSDNFKLYSGKDFDILKDESFSREENGRTIYKVKIAGQSQTSKSFVDLEKLDVKRYLKNPIILSQHDQSKPIGRSITLEKDINGWDAEFYFGRSQLAKEKENDWNDGILSAASIGGKIINNKPVLLEVSLVSVPEDETALKIRSEKDNDIQGENHMDELQKKIDSLESELETLKNENDTIKREYTELKESFDEKVKQEKESVIHRQETISLAKKYKEDLEVKEEDSPKDILLRALDNDEYKDKSEDFLRAALIFSKPEEKEEKEKSLKVVDKNFNRVSTDVHTYIKGENE